MIYHGWNHPLIILLYPPPLIPGIVSTCLILPFYTCVHSISTTFSLLHPFLISSPPPTGTNSQTGPVYKSLCITPLQKYSHSRVVLQYYSWKIWALERKLLQFTGSHLFYT
jgi:hypothetical protein